jgi:Uma2 family endonuclease
MSSAYRLLPHYTYEDYCRWEGQWELIEGIPYAMSPLPAVRHQDLSGNLYLLFREALKNANCSCKVYLPIDYKVSEDTVLQPDLLITCKDITQKKFLDETPELTVEILSPSTALKDLNSKFHIYQHQKVPFYLVVDPAKELIEIFSLENEQYHKSFSSRQGSFLFLFHQNCTINVQFDALWL